jgi:hypothetical protein
MRDETADRDAWVSGAEAARILGVSRRTVFRMVDRGELETRGRYERPNFRRESIEAAKQRGPAISLTTAARLLGRSPNFLRDLIAAGELTSFSNPKWPVFRLEVERYAKEHPPPPPGSPSLGRAGQLDTRGAAEVLGLGVDRVRQLARADLIPSDQDARGRYLFQSEHLASYMRAKTAATAAEYFTTLPTAPDAQMTDD